MAKVSTLLFVLDNERNELIDLGEVLDLEATVYRKISKALDQYEITAKPSLVSSILRNSGIA